MLGSGSPVGDLLTLAIVVLVPTIESVDVSRREAEMGIEDESMERATRMHRREFLWWLSVAGVLGACDRPGTGRSRTQDSSAGGSSASVGAGDSSGAASTSSSAIGSLRRRAIPGTDEELPVVGLGTWRQFDVTGEEKLDRLAEVLRRMRAAGGEVVDTSPMYGRAEAVLGALMGRLEIREELFVATKVWTSGRDDGIAQMRSSMDELGVEAVDLMQIHNLVDWKTHLPTLERWKADGTIRYIGITHYTTASLDELARVIRSSPAVDFVQFAYSMETRAAEGALLDVAAEHDVATIVNRPFEGGSLFGRVRGKELPEIAAELECESWAQFFLKYLLADERITCVIPGTSDPEHVVDNLGAATGPLPDASQRREMLSALQEI